MITRLRATLTMREREEGIKLGKLLEMWLEVGRSCHLHCSYCFNEAGGVVRNTSDLSVADYLSVLEQAYGLGGLVVGIPGFGEPFHPANLPVTMAIVRHLKEYGCRCHVFTTADLIDEKLAGELKELDVSLLIKWNSFKPEVQDRLVGQKGYTARRWRTLEILLNMRFNGLEVDEDGQTTTRLGFVTSVIEDNREELPDILRYCRQNNIYPDFDMILAEGRGKGMIANNLELLTRQTFDRLSQIDREEFGHEWEVASPTYTEGCCDRFAYHVYMDCCGNVSPCLGFSSKDIYLGNVRTDPLEKMWNLPLMRRVRGRQYIGKCLDCKSFQTGACNSCLGRFAACAEGEIRTFGCRHFVR